jgi:SPP1 gp7 family putative phage head morphogenesis protein
MVNTALTAWMTGTHDATRLLERRGVRFADTFAEDFGTTPVQPKEAIAWIQGRAPLPLKRLETVLEQIQTKSAFLTKDLLDTVSNRIDVRIAEALESGEGMRAFLKSLDKVIETAGLTAADPYYWETVFRTNAATAYSAGREEMFEHPDVADAFGYYQYLTVGDSAVRASHAALHGRVWKRGDPAVDEFYPPNGFSCRCVMSLLDKEELDDEGLKVSKGAPKVEGKRVRPDKGKDYDFTGKPSKRFGIKKPRKGERGEVQK